MIGSFIPNTPGKNDNLPICLILWLLQTIKIAIIKDKVEPAPPNVANISWNCPVIMFGISWPALYASRFSTDNAFKIGLNTAPTTLEPFIPKNQNPCKNRYAITIAGKVLPNFNNGTCKILNMKLCKFS